MHNDSFHIAGNLTVKTFKAGALLRQVGPFPNKVVTSSGYGRNLILRQMAGDITYPIELDSASLGTNSTAAADADTDLNTPTVTAIPLTNMTVVNNVLTVDVFVADGNLANGTYAEFGLFANLRLISRIIISPSYTKATGEDTLFTYELTLTG
jgi:hypothetical protein